MIPQLDSAALGRLREALATKKYVSGKTYCFYHYPARFHPDIARAVIEAFSAPNDLLLDPFMGGGTSIIEGLALGRRALGVDINAVAHFIVDVRTTPLSTADEVQVTRWVRACKRLADVEDPVERAGIPNLPRAVEAFVAGALRIAEGLPHRRQRAFARCALLRLGQWALDCRDFAAPRRRRLAKQLPVLVNEMLVGMAEFVDECRAAGIPKDRIRGQREIRNQSVVGLELDQEMIGRPEKPRLVLTSPPYPGVHVLYHRWQYRGRKETAAPYWIADVRDGCGGSYYTCGDRKPAGVEKYFNTIAAAFRSIRAIASDDAWVVQLVGFNNIEDQLPRYLDAMSKAGFEEWSLAEGQPARMGRTVPHRKWYAKLKGQVDASSELLLVHRASTRPSTARDRERPKFQWPTALPPMDRS